MRKATYLLTLVALLAIGATAHAQVTLDEYGVDYNSQNGTVTVWYNNFYVDFEPDYISICKDGTCVTPVLNRYAYGDFSGFRWDGIFQGNVGEVFNFKFQASDENNLVSAEDQLVSRPQSFAHQFGNLDCGIKRHI